MEHCIANYESADLELLTDFLNKTWEFDTITKELLDEKLSGDPDWQPELALIYRKDKQIIGFMQAVIRDIREIRYGYIKLMGVDEKFRRQGIAKALYTKLESFFIKQNVNNVRIYDVPLNYWMPGIDPRYTAALCWAMRMGFKRFGDAINLTVNLEQDWNTSLPEKKLANEGIEIRRATLNDKQSLFNFINNDWALWCNEVEMAFKDIPSSIHIALINGNIKAFSAHNGNNKGTGWFGPMGTHPDLRGKGIGAILLKRCLNDMKKMGLKHSIIPWVAHIDFYVWNTKARAERVFWRFEKILSEYYPEK